MVMSSVCLRLLLFLLAVLIPVCDSSSPAFHMMYSACKLNKQDDNIQPWCTLFPILNHSVVPCLVLTVVSWPEVSQEAGQVIWYSHFFKKFPQFVVIHIVKGFIIVNEAEVDVFVEFSCFFYDPVNAGNLISGSSAFSKSVLYISMLLVYVLLKTSLKDTEHYLGKHVRWVQLCGSLNILWHCLSLWLEWKLTFFSPWPLVTFPNLLAYYMNSIIF